MINSPEPPQKEVQCSTEIKPKKPRRLTIKQQKFVAEYIKSDGNGTQSALKVYDSKDYDTAHSIAVENLQKLPIRQAVIDGFNKTGLTPEKATRRLNDWVDSNKHDASLRALDMYGKWQGLGSQGPQDNRQVNIHVDTAGADRLDRIVKAIETLNNRLRMNDNEKIGEVIDIDAIV